VVPLFALANAGVAISASGLGDVATSALGGGIVLGLILGKVVGITAFSWAAVRLGIGELPQRVSWGQLTGAACAAGIGFTVSLFITDLAFDDEGLVETAKLAVLMASLGAAAVAALILRSARPTTHEDPESTFD
jgi:Na+/H+ antiporter NhaA